MKSFWGAVGAGLVAVSGGIRLLCERGLTPLAFVVAGGSFMIRLSMAYFKPNSLRPQVKTR
jgi:hypothetical protein